MSQGSRTGGRSWSGGAASALVFGLAGLLVVLAAPAALAEETECENEMISGPHQNVTVVEGSMCEMDMAMVSGNVTIEEDAGLMVMDSDIAGNVSGREGSGLAVMDSSIGGNVRLVEGSMLFTGGMGSGTSIGGNLETIGAEAIMLLGDTTSGNVTTIGGNASFRETGESPMMMPHLICGTEIDGNTEIIASGNMGQVWKIGANSGGCDDFGDGNVFHGNLLLQANEAMLDVDDNTVDRSLQAFGNTGGVDISDNTIGENLQCFDNDPDPTNMGGDNMTAGREEGECAVGF